MANLGRAKLLSLCTILLLSEVLLAGDAKASSIVQDYIKAFKEMDREKFLSTIHPTALSQFKSGVLSQLRDANTERSKATLKVAFDRYAKLEDVPDDEFFWGIFSSRPASISRQVTGRINRMLNSDIKILGDVPNGPALHVLVRLHGADGTEVRLFRLEKYEGIWKISFEEIGWLLSTKYLDYAKEGKGN